MGLTQQHVATGSADKPVDYLYHMDTQIVLDYGGEVSGMFIVFKLFY